MKANQQHTVWSTVAKRLPSPHALLWVAPIIVSATFLVGMNSAQGNQPKNTGATEATGDKPWASLGRPATSDEIKAWDIDVRADFKGLPAGSGSVEQGEMIWEAKCESCHGTFGESGEVFTPLVGGTSDEDIKRGRVARLNDGSYPARTTLMKLSQISTLWDYINRAMPWNAPKSLKPDEVYAVIAYILYLGDVVEDDFVFSNENIAEVQAILPNRNGMFKYEPMWQANGPGDVQNEACMSDCKTELEIRAFLPDYARDAHGNLAEQNRIVGATRGAITNKPKPASLSETREMAKSITVPAVEAEKKPAAPAKSTAGKPAVADQSELATKSNCMACHGIDKKLVGPAFTEVAARYAGDDSAVKTLSATVINGGGGNWGPVPMPANANVKPEDAKALVEWILSLGQ
jgi:cytochrome c